MGTVGGSKIRLPDGEELKGFEAVGEVKTIETQHIAKQGMTSTDLQVQDKKTITIKEQHTYTPAAPNQQVP